MGLSGHDLVQLLAAIVAGLAIVLAAGVTALVPLLISTRRSVKRAESHAAAASDGINNNHAVNFRDQYDERHGAVMATLGRITTSVVSIDDRLAVVEGLPTVVDETTARRNRRGKVNP